MVSWAAASDVGRVRAQNQDAVYPTGFGSNSAPVTLAVADGLGGAPGGEIASQLAIEAVGASAATHDSAADLVSAASGEVQDYLERILPKRPELSLMGTTLTVAVICPDWKLDVAHVGDSRLYLYSTGRIAQITHDHTLAMDKVRAGLLDAEQARRLPEWHVLSRWIGAEDRGIESVSIEIEPGDRVLLCSDGLTNVLADHDIARLLGSEPDDQRCAQALIDAANEGGGPDNITVALASIS